MSDTSQGEGWWQASDGKWYPPQTSPATQQPQPPMVQGSARSTGFGCLMAALIIGGIAVLGFGLVVLLMFVTYGTFGSWMYEQDDTEQDTEIAEDAVEAECLTSDAGFMGAEVEVTNNSPITSTYFIDVVFEYPRTGDQLESATTNTYYLTPGDSATLEVLTLTEPPPGGFTCEVADVNRSASEP